jgi:hypothetical protein
VALTYLILSFNRQNYARRQLLSLSSSSSQAVVIDGSPVEWGSGNLGAIGALNWEYRHIPGEFNYLERMRMGLNLIESEYVCLLDDQDMYFPSSHMEAIQELKSLGSKFSCIATKPGRSFSFDEIQQYCHWGHWTKELNFQDEFACQRASNLLDKRRTANLYYAPIKTELLKEFLRQIEITINKEQYYVWGFAENALAIFLASKGHIGFSKRVGWLRTDEADETKSKNFQSRRMIASTKDVSILYSLVSNHSPACGEGDLTNTSCELAKVLKTWVGNSEIKHSISSGELKHNPPNLRGLGTFSFYVRIINKFAWVTAPWLRNSISKHRKQDSKLRGGVTVFPIENFRSHFSTDSVPAEMPWVAGVHRLFPRGINKESFLDYSK